MSSHPSPRDLDGIIADVLRSTLATHKRVEMASFRAALSGRCLGPITNTTLHNLLVDMGASSDELGGWTMIDHKEKAAP